MAQNTMKFLRPTEQELRLETAFGDIDFPVSKRELEEAVDGRTVIFHGKNHDLRDLVRNVPDDAFDTEEELLDALLALYGPF